MGVQEKFNEANQAVSEVNALVKISVEWFDGQDWRGEHSPVLDNLAHAFGVLARTAMRATTKMAVLETALAGAQVLEPGECDLTKQDPGRRP